MLDDVAEKARRNLMGMSTGILAVFALGIPLDGKLVGAVNLSAVQPWRAWSVALIALVYFAARYHYAPEQADRWKEWKDRRQQKLKELKDGALECALKGPLPTSTDNIFLQLPSAPSDPGWRLLPTTQPTWNGPTSTFDCKWVKSEKNGLRRIRLGSKEDFDGETTILSGHAILAGKYLWKLRWQSFRFAYAPSWNLLEISVPWILAIAAAIVCVWRILVSLYYDWPFVRQLLPA